MKPETIGFLLGLIIGFIPAVLMGIYMTTQINWEIIDNSQLFMSAMLTVALPGFLWLSLWLGIGKLTLWVLQRKESAQPGEGDKQ